MTDIGIAIKALKDAGIEGFESSGILVIPCSSPEEILNMASKARRIFKEIGFEKSWQIDPYFVERHSGLREEMFGDPIEVMDVSSQ